MREAKRRQASHEKSTQVSLGYSSLIKVLKNPRLWQNGAVSQQRLNGIWGKKWIVILIC